MVVLLFRHGHKAFSVDNDPALSPKGFEQAQHLAELIGQNKIPLATHCWVSEKIRAFQTMERAVHKYKIATFKKAELNYRGSEEEHTKFKNRIQKFLHELAARAKESEVHYICTHYDWIEEALLMLNCDKDLNSYEYANWAPGQYLMFDLDQNNYKLLGKGSI